MSQDNCIHLRLLSIHFRLYLALLLYILYYYFMICNFNVNKSFVYFTGFTTECASIHTVQILEHGE